ncbi:MAG: hypothetical protein GX280_09025 [Lentisphaerae bacterium]|jgi:hypothetical protein|nr:hypothetical protein [Victivallaceae bacterium]MDD3704205.1 hypothetical protein [Victivallaceae bacterium]MDD5664106.1 hypothetical protein [Victivallaceae bacterium]NLK84201.1 hypothetical protein [Lentisphaerota bacterium]
MKFFVKNSCQNLLYMLKLVGSTNCRGQVLSEYAIMLVMCLLIAVALVVFGYYFTESGWRMITQVGIGYP